MNVIVNIDSQKFSFNGIPSFKNFMPHVIGDKLAVVNVYDSKLKLCDYEEVSQFTVNGVVHTTMSNLVTALLPVLYTRASLGSGPGTTPTLPQVLAQGDRTIRLSDGDGETHLELDDRGKLVFNAEADFLYLTTGIFPVNTVLKIYNAGAIDLFGIFTGDYWGITINGIYIDEFTGFTLNPGTAILKKLDDGEGSMEQWLLTYEISEFSKEALGLGDVDNTADINKPVSTAQAAAITLAATNARNEAIAQSTAQLAGFYLTAPAKIAIDTNVSTLSGAITAQGTTAGASDVVLLMAQSDQTKNGLWVIPSSGVWIRPSYYNTGIFINKTVIQVYDGDYSGREYKSIGSVGSNITITEVTDSKLKSGIGTDTKSSMSQKAITDELKTKVTKWASGLDGAAVANTLTITPTYSQLIPGNTFEAGDVVVIQSRATAPGAKTSASSLIAYVNETDDLSGATQIGIFTTAATGRTPQIRRHLSIKGSTTKVAVPATTSLADDFNATAAMAPLTIDWTVDQYIIFAISHTVADQTLTGDMYTIQKL
jgi:hypothetical protein